VRKKVADPPYPPLGLIYQFMLITLHLIALGVDSELKCAVIVFFPEKKICECKNENILKTNSGTIEVTRKSNWYSANFL
jgi:hypothetical protein